MGPDRALDFMNVMLWNAVIIAGPIMLATLIVGLVISVFQVATQIQEITLSYVPKILTAVLLSIALGPWMTGKLTGFARELYTVITTLLVLGAIESFGDSVFDARHIVIALEGAGKQMLFWFIGAAFFFMVIDQIIVRKEFSKQMRMSRRELTRESREQDGEPRFKQKRKEIHQAMVKQAEGLGKVEGSDFLVTNPDHYAVALFYDAKTMDAPMVRAKGRNHFAQLMKRKARLAHVSIIANPPLARALYRDCNADQPIAAHHFHEVAKLYLQRNRTDENKDAHP